MDLHHKCLTQRKYERDAKKTSNLDYLDYSQFGKIIESQYQSLYTQEDAAGAQSVNEENFQLPT